MLIVAVSIKEFITEITEPKVIGIESAKMVFTIFITSFLSCIIENFSSCFDILFLFFLYIITKYENEIKTAKVVDKFPPAAIMYGSFPIKAYTNVIESTQLKNCSKV